MPVLVGGLFNILCPCNPNAPATQTLYPAVMLWRVFVANNPPTRQRVILTLSVTLAKHTLQRSGVVNIRVVVLGGNLFERFDMLD